MPYDDVAPAVAGDAEHVVDLPDRIEPASLREALTELSRVHPDEVHLVLPAPGDPRGLPGPGEFTGAALLAEEAVLAGPVGLVPAYTEHTSGSGDTWHSITWRAYPLPPGMRTTELVSAAEAEADLATALAETTRTLDDLDVARWRPELAPALAALRSGDHGELPPGFDPRSRRLYARASILDGVLALAEHDAPGAAVNVHEAAQRSAALRPLATACRRALVAACNSPLRPC